ncbi:MAG: sensor histidine kinase [Hyphomicrobiaceae bacterium]
MKSITQDLPRLGIGLGQAERPNLAVVLSKRILAGILCSVAMLPVAIAVQVLLRTSDVHIIFLVPVIVAATRFGLSAGLAAAASGMTISAYFIYPPIYSLRVLNPEDAVALAVFVVVAAITSQLSATAQTHAVTAARSYRQLELLYAFTRKLASASGPDAIVAAIQEHASALVGRHVSVITLDDEERRPDAASVLGRLPEAVRRAVLALREGKATASSMLVSEGPGGRNWLLRPFSRNARSPGVLVVELDVTARPHIATVRAQADALLDEAAASLERLDLASTVAEAEMRRQSEALREAIIGTASHSLRTPLASILGAASVMARTSAVASDERLASLAQIVVSEAERLNGDIQKMLDAATLSGARLKPEAASIEPADLVNAVVEARRRELAGHPLEVDCGADLPLVHADPAMASSALGLILDNAARYSDPGSPIRILARADGDEIAICVEDAGVGLEPGEAMRIFEKFYRGPRVRDRTRGTGLGLWIASAFVAACKGRITAAPREDTAGTRVTVHLPAATEHSLAEPGESDEH